MKKEPVTYYRIGKGTTMDLLEVKGLSKHYKKFFLEDISFIIPAGYIMGYIGQNGAGKTTTLNAITHLVRPDAGETEIDGVTFKKNPVAYRESIGYIGDASYFPDDLTQNDVRKILSLFYSGFDVHKYKAYTDRWELPEKGKIKNYSRGMKVKLMFAAALSRDTKLLILDEATNGLDPVMRKEILGLLQDYISDGEKSVLFSTHIMEDLQDIADFIFLIDQGKKVVCDTKDELLERYLLVKGGTEDLTVEMQKELIGIEKGEYGFRALFDTDKNTLLSSTLSIEKPTIDQIVVHMIRQNQTS